jgi:hypothetical protein
VDSLIGIPTPDFLGKPSPSEDPYTSSLQDPKSLDQPPVLEILESHRVLIFPFGLLSRDWVRKEMMLSSTTCDLFVTYPRRVQMGLRPEGTGIGSRMSNMRNKGIEHRISVCVADRVDMPFVHADVSAWGAVRWRRLILT